MGDGFQPTLRRMEVDDLQELQEFQFASPEVFAHQALCVNLQQLDDLNAFQLVRHHQLIKPKLAIRHLRQMNIFMDERGRFIT